MLENGYYIFRAGFLEQLRPRGRIILLRLKSRDEILVAEFVLGAVGGNVVLIFVGAFVVHVARIPLIAERWHRIDAPMNEYPELRVHIPVRNFIALQRLPVCAEAAPGVHTINVFEKGSARRVK